LAKHVAVTFKYGGPDMAKVVVALEAPMIVMPSNPDEKVNDITIFKWKREYEEKDIQL